MKKHILVLGSAGMAGHILNLKLRSMPDLFDVTDVARNRNFVNPDVQMDLCDFGLLKDLFNKLKPDIIINLVGILNKEAIQNPSNTILINSYLPRFLEKITNNTTCKLIQISTDCVFSGKKGNYIETDFRDARDDYGLSKIMGEINNNKDLTIRTSIVGPELKNDGIGLFNWFSLQSESISGFSNVYWTGITTLELSNSIIACIKEDIVGIYHMVNGTKISKFELLDFFKNAFPNTLVTGINADMHYNHDKSLVNTRSDLNYKVKSYQSMIDEMKTWIIKNSNLYPHYKSML